MDDLKIMQDFIKVYCDSMSSIYLAKNQVYHVRMKHIDVRYHFICDVLEDVDIELNKIHTNNNKTDMLTKVIFRVEFKHCKNLLRILLVLEFGGAHLDELREVDPLGSGYVGNRCSTFDESILVIWSTRQRSYVNLGAALDLLVFSSNLRNLYRGREL